MAATAIRIMIVVVINYSFDCTANRSSLVPVVFGAMINDWLIDLRQLWLPAVDNSEGMERLLRLSAFAIEEFNHLPSEAFYGLA
jgi:hypothetical protein